MSATAMSPAYNDKYAVVVQRLRAARVALQGATDPDTRNLILEELGKATRELTELILAKEGRLKSPLE